MMAARPAFAEYREVGGVFAEDEHRDEQRDDGDGPVVALDAGEFDVVQFNRFFNAGRERSVKSNRCGGGLLRNGASRVGELDDGIAEDDCATSRRIGVLRGVPTLVAMRTKR